MEFPKTFQTLLAFPFPELFYSHPAEGLLIPFVGNLSALEGLPLLSAHKSTGASSPEVNLKPTPHSYTNDFRERISITWECSTELSQE